MQVYHPNHVLNIPFSGSRSMPGPFHLTKSKFWTSLDRHSATPPSSGSHQPTQQNVFNFPLRWCTKLFSVSNMPSVYICVHPLCSLIHSWTHGWPPPSSYYGHGVYHQFKSLLLVLLGTYPQWDCGSLIFNFVFFEKVPYCSPGRLHRVPVHLPSCQP